MTEKNKREYRRRIYARYIEATSDKSGPEQISDLPGGLRNMLQAVVRRHFPVDRNARILDLGCGCGLLLHFARQAGYRNVEGIDVSPQQVATAKRLGIAGVREAELMETLASLAPESHDVLLSFDVLEHMTRDELIRLIDRVHSVLKPGGRWIIHTVNAESPFFGRVRFGDITHEAAFTRRSLRQIMIASGFTRVDCFEDTPQPLGLPGIARWALWKAVRLPALIWLFAESGSDARSAILSQNLVSVVYR